MGLIHRLAASCFPDFLETRLLRRGPRPRVAVLMYHEVLPDAVDLPSWLVVKESEFHAQMQYIKAHYEVVPLDEALERLHVAPAGDNGRPLATITFDDGYSGNLSCAHPILERLDLPCTVYVATSKLESGGRFWYDDVICGLLSANPGTLRVATSRGEIVYTGRAMSEVQRWSAVDRFLSRLKALPADEREAIAQSAGDPAAVPALRMMTPDELGMLARSAGVTIGNHTHAHELLDQVSLDRGREAIERAQALLERWTGTRPHHFSYPNGNYVPATAALVRDLGFATAVTTQARPWTTSDSAFEIPRLGIGRFDNLNLVRAKAAGLFTEAL